MTRDDEAPDIDKILETPETGPDTEDSPPEETRGIAEAGRGRTCRVQERSR